MSLKSLHQEVRICFVGESFVNGTGDPECLGWTGRICVGANKKGYDITYYNLGVRRETSVINIQNVYQFFVWLIADG
jgi:hypothetical protein